MPEDNWLLQDYLKMNKDAGKHFLQFFLFVPTRK